MNLLDAIRSGKRFRHRSNGVWWRHDENGVFIQDVPAGRCELVASTAEWFVSNEWQTEDTTVTVTAGQIDEAILSIVHDMAAARGFFPKHVDMYRLFEKARRCLGLEAK